MAARKTDVRATKHTLLWDLKNMFETDEQLLLFLDKMAVDFRYPKVTELTDELERTPEGKVQPNKAPKTDKEQKAGNFRNYKKWFLILVREYNLPAKKFTYWKQVANRNNPVNVGFKAYNVEEDYELYKKAIEELYSNLKSELLVFDYLERHHYKNARGLDRYLECHERYFEQILSACDRYGREFNYMRILALPFDYVYQGKSEFQRLMDTLENCSLLLFKHICDYLKTSNEVANKQTPPGGFYIPGRKVGFIHYMLINKGEYVIKEDYYYKVSGEFSLAIVFVDEPNKETRNVYNKYSPMFQGLLSEPETIRISNLEQIHNATVELSREVQERCKYLSLNSNESMAQEKLLKDTLAKLEYITKMMEKPT